jgi:exo-1,4-beta-D-glucosaminidase
MNYESARGMFEAYGRNKYSATGITTWKYDAAWPASPTWQYIDWYLMAGGAYYGAKKACEPLHVQYSYDDRSVWVVNNQSSAHSGLKVTARVLDLAAKERFSTTAKVDVRPDGKTNVFTIPLPDTISPTFFVLLTLEDPSGKVISDNRYWLSTVPDIPGKPAEGLGRFQANQRSLADFTALQNLKPVKVNASARFEEQGMETVGRVEVTNPDSEIAFLVRLGVGKGPAGDEITPAYWEDNYLMLMPRETRRLRFASLCCGPAGGTNLYERYKSMSQHCLGGFSAVGAEARRSDNPTRKVAGENHPAVHAPPGRRHVLLRRRPGAPGKAAEQHSHRHLHQR